jgi:hypothetical protein
MQRHLKSWVGELVHNGFQAEGSAVQTHDEMLGIGAL